MAEQFDVCCVFEAAPANLKRVMSELFRAGSSWLGNPESFVLFTTKDILARGSWSSLPDTVQKPSKDEFFFVYSQPATESGSSRSCLGLVEKNGRAVYTMSVPMNLIEGQLASQIEERLYHIHEIANQAGPSTVFAGPELDVPSEPLASDFLSRASKDHSALLWIVGEEGRLPKTIESFRVAFRENGVVVLRHEKTPFQLQPPPHL